jgi:hypothetical protein
MSLSMLKRQQLKGAKPKPPEKRGVIVTVLKHFRLKREIKAAADVLEREFPENPTHEAKMRAFCERNGERVHFWTRVAKELDRRAS